MIPTSGWLSQIWLWSRWCSCGEWITCHNFTYTLHHRHHHHHHHHHYLQHHHHHHCQSSERGEKVKTDTRSTMSPTSSDELKHSPTSPQTVVLTRNKNHPTKQIQLFQTKYKTTRSSKNSLLRLLWRPWLWFDKGRIKYEGCQGRYDRHNMKCHDFQNFDRKNRNEVENYADISLMSPKHKFLQKDDCKWQQNLAKYLVGLTEFLSGQLLLG